MSIQTNRSIAIFVQNLKKSFASLIAVNDISFKVQEKEIIGILGPNGAGKTTTIRLITGLYSLDAPSKVNVFQWDMGRMPLKCKAQFGIVPEISNAFLDYTVYQNIEFSGLLYGLTKNQIKIRADILLKQFNLQEKTTAITKTLSKGLKQRLNFCMALIHDPPILILDEPTSGLDPVSVRLLREQILQLRATGKIILLTTHDMIEAQKICDRVLIINKGKIIVDESPDSLRTRFGNGRKISFRPEKELPEQVFGELKKQFKFGESLYILKNGFYQVSSEKPVKDIAILHEISEKHQIGISEIKLEEITLEDIFIQIIQKEEKPHV
jgi:ABC-2 type transport system ATP-binding protein